VTPAVSQNHNPDYTSRSALQEALGVDFDVQAARDNASEKPM
jgi:hypothetical protein